MHKAFLEVQDKIQDLSRGLREIAYRLQSAEREMRKCKITIQDLNSLPPDTPMYFAAGAHHQAVLLFHCLTFQQAGRKLLLRRYCYYSLLTLLDLSFPVDQRLSRTLKARYPS